jgi:hypothetical protein
LLIADNPLKTIAGKSFDLAWFTIVDTGGAAELMEANLKPLCKNDERMIRHIIIDLEAMVKELAVYKNKQ